MKFLVFSFEFLVGTARTHLLGCSSRLLKTQNSKLKTPQPYFSYSKSTAGFTLIELLVVTGIIAVVSGLVLANYNRFGGNVLLQNLAYDLALTIRQAQVYGTSVARFNNVFAPAYGMHFDIASPRNYVLFADVLTPQDGIFACPNPGTANCEIVQSFRINQNYNITRLCATPVGASETCGLLTLDISYQRPEPDAYIRSPQLPGLNESARIVLTSPQGQSKSVIVMVTGQVAVQ